MLIVRVERHGEPVRYLRKLRNYNIYNVVDTLADATVFSFERIYTHLEAARRQLGVSPSRLLVQTVADAQREERERNRPSDVVISCDGRSVTVTQAEFISMLSWCGEGAAFNAINRAFDFVEM